MKLLHNYKKGILLILSTIILISGYFFYMNNVFIYNKVEIQNAYGIIDGHISTKYKNFIINDNACISSKYKTHGDKVIKFYNEITINTDLNSYYYDSEIDGVINDQSIISGLNWMIENNVKKVDISLSSKYYSQELGDWIKQYKDKIKIYCSYNNKINTNDYPAMYEYVVASGHNDITYKEIDKKYRSDTLVILPHFNKFKGTTFLSILTMLNSD